MVTLRHFITAGAAAMFVSLAVACAPTPAPPPDEPASPLASLHHKCYSIRSGGPAVLVDFRSQFTREQVPLGAPLSLCAPVLKNEHGTLDSTYLKCYSIAGGNLNVAVNLNSTQFGDEVHDVGPAISVCVPANKAEAPNTPTQSLPRSPYYLCYLISGETPEHAPVTLRTHQFPLEKGVVVGQPRALCAPALKDPKGTEEEQKRELERIQSVFPHLKCYEIQGNPPGKRVNLLSILGPEQNVPVGRPLGLCAPVEKTLLSDIET